MTKDEILSALEKSDKWEMVNHYTFNMKSNFKNIIFIYDNFFDIILNDNGRQVRNELVYNYCNLIDSVPMKSGKIYSAIICQLPSITLEVEL